MLISCKEKDCQTFKDPGSVNFSHTVQGGIAQPMRSSELCHTSFTKIDIRSQFENICVLKKSSARLDRLRVVPLVKIYISKVFNFNFDLEIFKWVESFELLNFNTLSYPLILSRTVCMTIFLPIGFYDKKKSTEMVLFPMGWLRTSQIRAGKFSYVPFFIHIFILKCLKEKLGRNECLRRPARGWLV